MADISQTGASAASTTAKGNTTFTLTPTLNSVAAIKSGSSFYWDNPNGSTVRWLWQVKNAAPTNQKTCFGLWFTGETWGGGAPVSVTSGTNPGILVTISQTVTSGSAMNRMVVSARPDSGVEKVFYDGYFSFVSPYATAYTNPQSGYLTSSDPGSIVDMRLDLTQSRWQLTFNGISLDGATNTVANGTQISDNKRLVFGYWDSALGTAFWKHGAYTSWSNTWSPFTKSIVTAATGAISSSGATPSPMDLRYVIATDPGLPGPLPPGPDKLSAAASNGSVQLAWNASSGATSYNLKRSGTLSWGYSVIATGTGLSYVDTAVTNGSTYYYEVTAQTANGESVTGPVVRAIPDSNSRVAQLRFDETSGTSASDSTGHGWNGALLNGAGWGVGKFNNAMRLSMSGSQYATLPFGIVNGMTDCTISVWIKPASLSSWMRIFDFGTSTSNYMFLTPQGGSGNRVHFGIVTPSISSEQYIESSSSISAGVWTHLAVTISGSTGTLYVNGVASGTNNAMTVNPASLGNTFQNYLGKSQWSTDPYYDGLIDEFQIFGRALSSSEVAALAAPPSAPGGVAASGSLASVVVSWNPVGGATGYNVMRSLTSGTGFVTVGTAVSGTSFTDTGLANNTTYYYTVTSLNGASESTTSSEVNATTYSAPVVGGSLIAGGATGSAFSYQIVASNGPTSFGATGLPSGLNLNSSSGLISGTPTVSGTYSVSISASNSLGTGSATLLIYVLSNQFGAPVGLSATGSNAAVALNWLPVSGAVSYKIKRSTTSGGSYTTVASGVSATNYRDSSLTNWTKYYYVASAVNGSSQESANSVEVSATPMAPTTWIGTGADANWQSAGNWSTQPVGGDTLYFAGSTQVTNTNNYPGNTPFGGIVFNSGGGAFVLGGNALMLLGDMVNNSTSAQTLNLGLVLAGTNRAINTASGNVSIPGVISENGGSFGLIKTGNSALSLSGVNTFSGGTTLNAGTLQVSNGSALGTGTVTANGGTLKNTAGVATTNNLVVNGATTLDVTGGNWNFNGNISGGGAINRGTGATLSMYLGGDDSLYTGTFTVPNNGNAVVRFNAASAGSAGARWVFNDTTVGRTTLEFTSGTISFGSLTGAGQIQGNNSGTKTISVGALGYNDTFSGLIQDGGGTIALIKTGTGTLTLSNTNSYSAGTTISGGALNVTGVLSGVGAVAINSGGTVAGTGTLSGATVVASGGAIAPGNGGIGVAGTLTFSNAGAALTFNGGSILSLDLSGTGNSDQIVLSGSVVASGTTTVNLRALAGFAGAGTYPVISGTGSVNAANFAIGTSIAGYGCALSASSGKLSVVVTNTIPAAPTGLNAIASNNSVALVWNAVPGASSYNVKRSTTNGSGYATITSASGTSCTDSTALNGTTYYYVVSGVSPAGEGGNSNQASATPASVPVITSGTIASGISGSAFSYQITANNSPISFGATGLPAGLSVNASTGLISGTPSATGTSNVTLSASNSNGTGTATLALTIQPAAPVITSATSVSGTGGVAFTYQIAATNSPTSFGATGLPSGLSVNTSTGLISGTPSVSGTIPASISASNVSGTGSDTLTFSILPAIPSAPTNLIASGSNGSVSLRWTAASGATSYNVKRSTTSGSGYVTVGSPSSTSCVDAGLVNGTTYYYVVSAVNVTGESANSLEVRVTPDANSLIASLRFDETGGTVASDSTGHGWNGTLNGGAGWSSGKINNAVNLNGSSQYVSLPNGIAKGVTDCTFSVWVNLTSVSNWMRIFDFGTGTNIYMFLSPQNGQNSKARFSITTSSSGGEQKIDAASAIATGTWTHVAVTLSGSTGIIYLNGVASGTNTAMTLNPANLGNTTQNYIGKSQWNDPYFNGLVDHFQIYSRALSPSEVAALAAPTAAPTGLVATGSNAAVIVKWNAVSGATAYNVLRSLTSGSGYSTAASAVTGTNYTDSGLTNGTRYYYRLTALNGLAESSTSSEVSAIPDGTPPVVSVPANITVYATGANGAVVTFSTSANDAISGPCATTSAPPSGSVFAIGTSTVTTTATDASGNVGSATFTVTVQTLPISSNEQQGSTFATLSGSTGTLFFASPVAGHSYQLQYCDDLAAGTWQNYGAPQVGDSANLQFNLPVTPGQPRRFYRVQITK
jgi:autotransporter-associated beta strand protein